MGTDVLNPDAPAAPEKSKRRRLKGNALGELRVAVKRLRTAHKHLTTKREELLDAQNLNLDQVPNWSTGAIFDLVPKDEKDAGEKFRPTVIGHLNAETRAAQRGLVAEVEQADGELSDLLERLAERLGCMPADIDANTGELRGEAIEGVDPFAASGPSGVVAAE